MPHNAASMLLLLLVALLTPHYSLQQNCLAPNDVRPAPLTLRSDLYRGQQAFTVDMLAAIQKATPNENIFFSPYSTYHALLLAYFGAQGVSEQELTKALHLEWAQNKAHVANGYTLEKMTRSLRAKKMPLEFASADKIYFDKSIKLTDCLASRFYEELQSLDFQTNAEQCRQDINGWIANLTHNEIPEMLTAGDVSSETQLVLANAAYFKGQWLRKFDAAQTSPEVFFKTPNDKSFVQMMHLTGNFDLSIDEHLGAYVLNMPYLTSQEDNSDSNISMVVILPSLMDNAMENVLAKLTPDTLEMSLKESTLREIEVSLPKFEFEQNLELVPILRNMGINSIFDHNADLSGFSTASKLNFGDAKHVAKIKVDEEGSTAAAATVLFSFRSARPIEPTKFECNHPFMFLIYDRVAKAILFTGIYRDPTAQK